ncbi:hypothetical protein C1645_815409 [Glomus cerebriforme]|uniref:Uncharacterized protein n=1 Tax=Glomus cerebriforme TaxID=658196 RepID=A0A397TEN3_9GLOM|nr:hypothetical protein C1645_815409 [Glomus cerebriforme]
MAKLHTYYITNAKVELKYVYQDIVEVEDDYDYDDDEDKVDDEDENENGMNNNSEIDKYLNLASKELRQLLEVMLGAVNWETKTALETDFRYIAIGNDFEELNVNFRIKCGLQNDFEELNADFRERL